MTGKESLNFQRGANLRQKKVLLSILNNTLYNQSEKGKEMTEDENNDCIAKLIDGEVMIILNQEAYYATSFHEKRIHDFFEEIKDTKDDEALEIIKQWNHSKMINFWPDLEIK